MNQKTNEIKIGPELVSILYENTNMNYDICAESLIKIFSYLKKNVEKLDSTDFIQIVESIKDSISDSNENPDLKRLDEHFNFLKNIKEELKSGESSYLDCEGKLEKVLYNIRNILNNRTSLKNLSNYFSSNREFALNLYEIWKLSSKNHLKCTIVQLLTVLFYSDNAHIEFLYLNTNILLDLCFILKEQIKLRESIKQMNLIEDVLDLIEENDEFVYKKVSEDNFRPYFIDLEIIESTLLNHLILFTLSLNSKFSLPEENFVLQYLLNFECNSKDFSVFGENLVSLFNLEEDPLTCFKLSNPEGTQYSLYNNCTIKMVSDLFSSKKTVNATSIFYLNDFKVLIDVIIRKLNNLSADDQIRSDYLSLIHLIIRNSSYIQQMYRIEDLLSCFNMILNERDEYTIDQDIVRIILSETPELLNNND